MFISDATITVQGGHGGAGHVSFFPMKGGPSGGNGGRGGDVYAVLNTNVTHLRKYREKTSFIGYPGANGLTNRREGASGKDLFLPMPPNTAITNLQTKERQTISIENPQILLCRGGRGGRGNDAFKSSINQKPRKSEQGKPGQLSTFSLNLHLIADYGLIGLPNVGKSTLLNTLTNAQAKTADYHFTTLEPNLGAYGTVILADIPGLIEGASKGKGLGITFLKHIAKVKMLLHCVSATSADCIADYRIVRAELLSYDPELTKKPEVILLTKTDEVSKTEMNHKIQLLKTKNPRVYPVSILSDESLEMVKKLLL